MTMTHRITRAATHCRAKRAKAASVWPPRSDIWHMDIAGPYSWKGALSRTVALRRAGQEDEARKMEREAFERGGRHFSILHATRRGKEALKAMYLWLSKAQNPGAVEWIFAVDADDQPTLAELEGHRVVVVPGESKGPVAAWNAVAAASEGHILIQMSDDWIPAARWDRLIVDRVSNLRREAVLRIDDGHRKDALITMAILTRAYYQRYGYVFHSSYFSMFSDNEFSLQAMRDGVILDAREIKFTHDHPIFTGEPLDPVYQRSNHPKNYQDGMATLQSRKHLFIQPLT